MRPQAWCDKAAKCRGFSASKPALPTDQLFCRFSDSGVVTYDGGWMTYAKGSRPGGRAAAYTYQPGYLGEGKALHEAFMTIEQARAYCDGSARCAGFTVDKEPSEPTMELFCRFRSSPAVSFDAAFFSYVKDAAKAEL